MTPQQRMKIGRSRNFYALRRREEGLTYKEIGILMGVQPERARQRVLFALRIMENSKSKYRPHSAIIDTYKEFVEHCNTDGNESQNENILHTE